MKRATLLLATALVGFSGCYSHTCDVGSTITLQWTFQSGGQQLTCSQAGVSVVHVFLDGQAQVDEFGSFDFTCPRFDSGAILTDYPGGQHTLQIDAFDQAGQLLFQDQRTIQSVSCGDTTVPIQIAAVQGSLVVQFTIPNNQCPTGSFIWYSLVDDTDPQHPASFSAVDGTHSPTSIPCAQSGSELLFAAVPFGTYTLDFLQVVVPTGDPNTPYVEKYGTCAAVSVQHTTDDVLQATLVDRTVPGTCP